MTEDMFCEKIILIIIISVRKKLFIVISVRNNYAKLFLSET